MRFLAPIKAICTVLYCRVADPGSMALTRNITESVFLEEAPEWLVYSESAGEEDEGE